MPSIILCTVHVCHHCYTYTTLPLTTITPTSLFFFLPTTDGLPIHTYHRTPRDTRTLHTAHAQTHHRTRTALCRSTFRRLEGGYGWSCTRLWTWHLIPYQVARSVVNTFTPRTPHQNLVARLPAAHTLLRCALHYCTDAWIFNSVAVVSSRRQAVGEYSCKPTLALPRTACHTLPGAARNPPPPCPLPWHTSSRKAQACLLGLPGGTGHAGVHDGGRRLRAERKRSARNTRAPALWRLRRSAPSSSLPALVACNTSCHSEQLPAPHCPTGRWHHDGQQQTTPWAAHYRQRTPWPRHTRTVCGPR